jgi:hypothetical protein
MERWRVQKMLATEKDVDTDLVFFNKMIYKMAFIGKQ